MKNGYKILSFASTSLLVASCTLSATLFSAQAMANNNANTQIISVNGSGGGLTPIPNGSGGGLFPDPNVRYNGAVANGSGDGLFPDPSARYDGAVANGSGDGLRPDPASTQEPVPQYCLLSWCIFSD